MMKTIEQKLESAKKSLLSYGVQPADAEDALQATILHLLEKGEDLATKPTSYFTLSAYRKCITSYRHYGRTPLLAEVEKITDSEEEFIDELLDRGYTLEDIYN